MNRVYTPLQRYSWDTCKTQNGLLYLTGRPFLDGRLTSNELLAKELSSHSSQANLNALMNRLDGFFSFIWITPLQAIACVDIVRSKPLFYYTQRNTLIVSDDPEIIRGSLHSTETCSAATREFRYTGYVTGRETLLSEIKQIQAGEVLIARKTCDDFQLTYFNHYFFLRQEPDYSDRADLLARLHSETLASILKLIEYANGRRIVVPLSGGYDSRTIVATLKLLRYENLICFSYGAPNSREVAVSEFIAEQLNVPWHFVEYNEEKWTDLWRHELSRRYRFDACSWSSLPHMQDFLAVKELVDRKILSTDCVLAPGHTADFSSGGHTPEIAFGQSLMTIDDTINEIRRRHYTLQSSRANLEEDNLASRIEAWFDGVCVKSAVDFANACDLWNWRERQAKYIVNSCRAYDYFNIDWFLPFWTRRYKDFWREAPILERRGRQLQLDHIRDVLLPMIDGGANLIPLANGAFSGSYAAIAKRLAGQHMPKILLRPLRALYQHMSFEAPLHIQSHFLLSGYNRQQVTARQKRGITVLGAHASLFLEELQATIPDCKLLDYSG